MPLDVLSASALVCERFLIEKDDVFSAIRIIDVFFVPKELPEDAHIEVNVLFTVKTKSEGDAQLTLKLVDPAGKELRIAADKSSIPDRVKAVEKFDDPNIPTGISLATHLNIRVRPLGTYCIKLELDESEKARAYFTLRTPPDKQS